MALDRRVAFIAVIGLLWVVNKLSPPPPQSPPKKQIVDHQEFQEQNKMRIPRSVPEVARYYLLGKEEGDGIKVVRTFVEQVGVNSITYTLTDIDCALRMYRVVGSLWLSHEDAARGRISPNMVPLHRVENQSWEDLVPGSSKSDLVDFVCRWK